jgi:hypothetical protein
MDFRAAKAGTVTVGIEAIEGRSARAATVSVATNMRALGPKARRPNLNQVLTSKLLLL